MPKTALSQIQIATQHKATSNLPADQTMSDIPEYEGINFVSFSDPAEEDLPSSKFGQEVFFGVMVGVMLLSGAMAVAILCCSRMQEDVSSSTKESKYIANIPNQIQSLFHLR